MTHLRENLAAAELVLSEDALKRLDALGQRVPA
jgi:aryl-alcohol dehydrogenase-like predicted oxidoreductase